MTEWRQSLKLDGDNQLADAMTAAHQRFGYSGALQVWLSALLDKSRREYVSPLRIAELYVLLGNRHEAFVWLEKAFQEHTGDLMKLNSYPIWDTLRSDRRFKDLVRRVGLPSWPHNPADFPIVLNESAYPPVPPVPDIPALPYRGKTGTSTTRRDPLP
jgi:hypothetical protein